MARQHALTPTWSEGVMLHVISWYVEKHCFLSNCVLCQEGKQEHTQHKHFRVSELTSGDAVVHNI